MEAWGTEKPIGTVASYDVVVVGYGCAGASAAIGAADAGARVLLVEKTAHLGGLSLMSSGYMRAALDRRGAAAYLAATNGGRVDFRLVDELAHGFVRLPGIVTRLAATAGAVATFKFGDDLAPSDVSDLYDWPGSEALGWTGIEDVPGFHGYPWANHTRGHFLMRTLELNVRQRGIDVWFDAPAQSLLQVDGEVVGVMVGRKKPVAVGARGGVVLATGGFEFSSQMLQDYLEIPVVHPIGHPGNTGDGIRMAQAAGASLWHMWHFHGSYGFKFPERDIAFRNHLGGARRDNRPVAWILVDQDGKRFMNESPRAPQDTPWRVLQWFDSERGVFDRIPCWMVFDESARCLGPIAKAVWTSEEDSYRWSNDNSVELERGWILSAETIDELGKKMGVPDGVLPRTVAEWNSCVDRGKDPLERPPGTMVRLQAHPFYAIQAWPICTNTHGGPRHDHRQRVLDTADRLVPGLYAVGELGSFFGHVYLLGGNLSEGVIGGLMAGVDAAERAKARRSTGADAGETKPPLGELGESQVVKR